MKSEMFQAPASSFLYSIAKKVIVKKYRFQVKFISFTAEERRKCPADFSI